MASPSKRVGRFSRTMVKDVVQVDDDALPFRYANTGAPSAQTGTTLLELFRVIYVFGKLPRMYGPPRD